jgi:hypothetical protein
MLRTLGCLSPNPHRGAATGPQGQWVPTRQPHQGPTGVDRRDLADDEVPGGTATTDGFLVARRAQRASRWWQGSSRRGPPPAMADGGACMTAVAPSLAIEERERSAAAPQCHTKHGKAIRGEETGREGASHGERRSTAMAAGGEGRGRIGPHLRTNNEDSSRPEKQSARRSRGRGGLKGDGVARPERRQQWCGGCRGELRCGRARMSRRRAKWRGGRGHRLGIGRLEAWRGRGGHRGHASGDAVRRRP